MENFKINDIDTVLIETNKFKTVTVIVAFLGVYDKITATKKSLLCNLLTNSTENYRTKKIVANQLFNLYGANVSVSCIPIYKTCVTVFSMEVINAKYTASPELLLEAFNFLHEVIYHPNINKEKVPAFDAKAFNEEKNILKDSIKNVYNNKSLYALQEMLKIMGPDEICSVSAQGDLEELATLNEQNMANCYYDMINNEEVKFFILGDVTKNDCEKYFHNFKFNNVKTNHEVVEEKIIHVTKIKEKHEVQNIKQSKLVIGIRTNINSIDELYVPLVVLNTMLGGMFSSDLFRVIREEHSLAYSISSRVFFDTKIMIISAGIDVDNYELAKSLIFSELERYKKGDLNLELLKMAKENLISSLTEIVDDPYEHLAFTLKNSMLSNMSISELISKINEVELTNIVKAAELLETDTIFLLRSE